MIRRSCRNRILLPAAVHTAWGCNGYPGNLGVVIECLDRIFNAVPQFPTLQDPCSCNRARDCRLAISMRPTGLSVGGFSRTIEHTYHLASLYLVARMVDEQYLDFPAHQLDNHVASLAPNTYIP